MTENEIEIQAARDRVWAILADPHRYAQWLFGTERIRDADETWPQPGARLHHSVGAGPATIDDSSEVLECDAPARLLLLARLGPLGSFHVEIVLNATGAATHVAMHETAIEGVSRLGGPITDAAVSVRNHLSLERLKELAEAKLPDAA